MHWFSQLPPGEQAALIVQAVIAVFTAGVYSATIRFLARRVKSVEENDKLQDAKLAQHGEQIATLNERSQKRSFAGGNR